MTEQQPRIKYLPDVFRSIADEFFPLSDFPVHILDFPEHYDDDNYDKAFYVKKRIRNKILSIADDLEKLND
jgi:hypothetical protein